MTAKDRLIDLLKRLHYRLLLVYFVLLPYKIKSMKAFGKSIRKY